MAEELLSGRYRRARPLGRGAVGEVWLAEDLLLGREVAIKRLRIDTAEADPAAVERMIREARLAARVVHPNVVAVHDLISADDRPYLIMQYVDGETLADRISRMGALPPAAAQAIIGQVAAGLAAAHELGIVHRDVKPANVLIDHSDVAKLGDFGIARAGQDASLTVTGMVIGTLAYLAPEVARGQSATSASDVWSLGATLFTALEGTPPYGSDASASAAAVLLRIVSEPPPVPRSAPALAPMVTAMLDPDPAKRPTAAQVAHRLSQLSHAGSGSVGTATMHAVPAAAAPRSPLPPAAPVTTRPASRWNRRRLGLASAGACVVSGVVITAVLAFGGGSAGGGPTEKGSSGAPGQPTSADAAALARDGASGASSVDGRAQYLVGGQVIAAVETRNAAIIGQAKLPTGTNAEYVQISPDGKRAYVLSAALDRRGVPSATRPGTVSVLQLPTGRMIKSWRMCGPPQSRGLILNDAGKQLIVGSTACVEVFDTSTFRPVFNYPFGHPLAPWSLPPAVAANGRTMYFVDDRPIIQKIQLVPLAPDPVFVAKPGDGVTGVVLGTTSTVLYAVSGTGLNGNPDQNGAVVVLNLLAGRIAGIVPVGRVVDAAAVSPDGRYLVAESSGWDPATHHQEAGSLSIIDLTGQTATRQASIGAGSGTLAFTPDGDAVLASSKVSGTVSLVSLASGTVKSTVQGGPSLSRTADGRVVYACSGATPTTGPSCTPIDAFTGDVAGAVIPLS